MTKLCDYGCGREATHHFLTVDKWCCEDNIAKCLYIRKEQSKLVPWNKNKKMGPQTKEHRNKIGKGNTGKPNYWKGKTRGLQTKEHKNKLKISCLGRTPWNKNKKMGPQTKEHIEKRARKNRMIIEQINEKYPFFSQIEEMRYDSYGNIQVTCEKCGEWFKYTPEQFRARRDSLERDEGNDGCYFYCSNKCKKSCCLYNLKSDPLVLSKFEKFNRKIRKETNTTTQKFKVPNIELRSYKHGYELDHKYSIFDGFINNVDPKIIAHPKNLQVITMEENKKKGKTSSITLDELITEIKKTEDK